MDVVWDVAAQLMLSRSFDERWRLALVIASGYARGPRYEAEREQASLAGVFADAALAVLWQFGD
jgi:hypothetical protein